MKEKRKMIMINIGGMLIILFLAFIVVNAFVRSFLNDFEDVSLLWNIIMVVVFWLALRKHIKLFFYEFWKNV